MCSAVSFHFFCIGTAHAPFVILCCRSIFRTRYLVVQNVVLLLHCAHLQVSLISRDVLMFHLRNIYLLGTRCHNCTVPVSFCFLFFIGTAMYHFFLCAVAAAPPACFVFGTAHAPVIAWCCCVLRAGTGCLAHGAATALLCTRVPYSVIPRVFLSVRRTHHSLFCVVVFRMYGISTCSEHGATAALCAHLRVSFNFIGITFIYLKMLSPCCMILRVYEIYSCLARGATTALRPCVVPFHFLFIFGTAHALNRSHDSCTRTSFDWHSCFAHRTNDTVKSFFHRRKAYHGSVSCMRPTFQNCCMQFRRHLSMPSQMVF